LWIDALRLPAIYEIDISLESYIAQLSVLAALCATVLVNLTFGAKEKVLEKVWQRNDIDALCSEAASELKPISITLDNRKVYIGLIYDSLEPGRDANLTILPLYSGYRDKDTLEMSVTRKYTSVDALFEELITGDGEARDEIADKLAEYRIVIPRARIITINLSVHSIHKTVTEPERSF